MKRLLLLFSLMFLYSGLSEPSEPTIQEEPEESLVLDNDPQVYPDEIISPALNYTSGPWFEDVNSVNCEIAPTWCESQIYKTAKANQEVK